MESKLEIALTSPAFWSLVGIGAYAGLSAIVPMLQGTPSIIITLLLTILGAYLHPQEVQKAGNTK